MKRDATVTEDESAAIDTDAAARTRRMYERILSSFAEHRLAPGTRLREERLAELFEVSRTQVRQVLQRLEHEGLVERKPRRGAVVTTPSREDTAEIFEARRLIEPWLVERVCQRCARKDLLGIKRIVREERLAHDTGDRRSAVRLSGEFHRALAALAGNGPLSKSMDELTVRTCLAILANQAPTGSTCRDDEHEQILGAIEAGDAKRAMRLMHDHLLHIEASLAEPPAPSVTDDLSVLIEDTPARAAPRRVRTSR